MSPTPCPAQPHHGPAQPAPLLLQKLWHLAVRKYLRWEARNYRTPLLGNQGLTILKKKKKTTNPTKTNSKPQTELQ